MSILVLPFLKIQAKDFIIFSIDQEFPMNDEHVDLKKNYYINMGKNQGIKKGSFLNVYRSISKLDPYKTKKRYLFDVKIGEVEILHLESDSAIAKKSKISIKNEKTPYFEIPSFMIGDKVSINVN